MEPHSQLKTQQHQQPQHQNLPEQETIDPNRLHELENTIDGVLKHLPSIAESSTLQKIYNLLSGIQLLNGHLINFLKGFERKYCIHIF